ncbi:uncharacterized protein EV422DRAFT_620570 [Fimicolochytrium jonesii]|uniref:uncharacterized protein n=1 Tax=Fimicolochytrium jonesii TaxID=1396493 RepID=UPI0022FE6B1C|nr:uncharacterized protein EV422DRAFT_620570 [Fimicolochytrium jonesii]KAI8820175.1 hypothetical protein EV422DRAFT_620570 [Fimicolochytrium jonesii]
MTSLTFLQKQAEVERLAEDILIKKQLVVDLDRRRNDNRMALRSIQKTSSSQPDKKTYFFAGGLFMKLPASSVSTLLTEDQTNIDGEIGRLRESMKEKASQLDVLERGGEGEEGRMKGFGLKGMGKDELRNIARR